MATECSDHFPSLITRKPATPLRILHLLGGLDRGGIETWLVHVLRQSDRSEFQMDFFVRGSERGEYEDEVEALGSKIGRTLRHRHPLQFEAELESFMRENGPYDIVHSHLSEYDGLVMWAASRLGVRVRISHSHNDTRCIDATATLQRRAYLSLGRRLIKSYSTHCLAASRPSAFSQFGESWETDAKVRVLHCGIDLAPFVRAKDAKDRETRRQLGLPDGAFVIGHVGRFVAQKNHDFLVRIVQLLARRDPSAHLLMVGSGPLLADVKSLVSRTGLGSRAVFLEPRPDIPRLMLEVMDVFLFPSLHEGLGLVLLEAQAAGLPCVASDVIPEEVCVSSGCIEFLSLGHSADEWADRIERYKGLLPSTPQVNRLSGTSFDIRVSAARLFELYSSTCEAKYSRIDASTTDKYVERR